MSGYEKIRVLSKETGLNIPDLIAMARQNDPFFVGSPAQTRMAEWFAELWENFGFSTGVHLRRVHYRLVSEYSPTGPNGKPYENTEGCWHTLCEAGKYARHLGLVDPAAFVDRRNPEPYIYMNAPVGEPGWDYFFGDWNLPEIPTRLSTMLDMPELYATGYEYEDGLQPYHVEVWCEKSTMNSELLPVCERLAANFIPGVGEMSITSVVRLLDRVRRLGKPARILYVSDFDPAGASMPVAVARKIEYGIAEYADSADANLRLNPLILTADQAREYELPRTPIKGDEKRKDKFEAINGTGATELDALEALHPGELVRIVEEAIQEYRDPDLSHKVLQTEDEAQEALQARAADVLDAPSRELTEVRREVAAIAQSYEDRLAALNAELQVELSSYRERIGALRQAIQTTLGDLEPDLPELPEPDTVPEPDGWLFDSGRDYFDQLLAYKSHQDGDTP